MKVVIVGGGPSGLVTLKYLSTAHHYFPIDPIEVICIEAESELGGTFKYRVYEEAELVSSKYLTAFSDHRFAKDLPDFITPDDMCQYLYSYAEKYDLFQYMCLGTKVVKAKRRGKSHALIIEGPTGARSEIECDAIAICSGLHVIPEYPRIPGVEVVPAVYHSSELKSRTQFGIDTNVVVLGAGETAMDIAWLAVTSPTKSVTICHRDGFFCGPKVISAPIILNGWISKPDPEYRNKPTDCAVASLFDTAYVPKFLQHSSLLWEYYDKWIKFSQIMISGTPNGPDQWAGIIPGERKHVDSIIFCKSDRALPYMSAKYRPTSLWYRIRSFFINVPIKDTKGRFIDVAPWPESVDSDGIMHFSHRTRETYDEMQGHVVKPDVVVFATGYRKEVRFLDLSYPQPTEATVRGIYSPEDITVGFIGFMRPSFGAIPPLAELQAQLWVYRLLQSRCPDEMPPMAADGKPHFPNSVAPYELDWALHCRDKDHDFAFTKGGVDHEAYAYQLALDMGAAPTFSFMLTKGFKVFFTWAMGSNFNPKFRLVGPWKNEGEAEEIMRTELYGVVKRTGGLFFFITYTVIPLMIFGTLSLMIHAIYGVRNGISRCVKAVFSPFRRVWAREHEEVHID
ncbi:related to flavin-containing monooxygenase [Cephalotrichum gorgonifer]|uniref:Related to flavin-containing monooxygenase n=1 Tax=Cephalotrichum gorgonifer TaxID=2041049 RepID=A0AAE8N207_9PEZI|nr:related to flavin-containing monooxygenase [Cephalotrichum gorgonifer]